MSEDNNLKINEINQEKISIRLDTISLHFSQRLSGSAIGDRVRSESKMINKCKITRK